MELTDKQRLAFQLYELTKRDLQEAERKEIKAWEEVLKTLGDIPPVEARKAYEALKKSERRAVRDE